MSYNYGPDVIDLPDSKPDTPLKPDGPPESDLDGLFDISRDEASDTSRNDEFISEAAHSATPPPENWPEPMAKAAFCGLAGDFVRLVLPHSEADPAALLLTYLVSFGTIVGRSPHYQVESTRHGTNLDAVLVGNTANGRKGTATDRVIDLYRHVDPEFINKCKASGLSSGEGLIHAVRDERWDDVRDKDGDIERKMVDSGVEDKRLLVVESEFSGVLQQLAREGNTLSTILRNTWDGIALRVLARGNKDACAEPHVSLIGNITATEVQRLLTTNDKANGFGNRILWCCVRRSKELPHGGKPLDPIDPKINRLIVRQRHAIEKAKDIGHVCFDDEAGREWEHIYSNLTRDVDGLFGALIARAAPQTVRLAMIYALLDGCALIARPHLDAAYAVWRYCEDSARFIFGELLGDDTADTILRELRRAVDGLTQTEISKLFHNHRPETELSRALDLLSKKNLIASEKEETGGRPVIRWRALAKKAN